MNKQQQAALETFMQFYESRYHLDNWEKKTVGKMVGVPGHETTKCIGDAYEAIRTILVLEGDEEELVAWLDEMHLTIVQWQAQASILYKALKDERKEEE